LRLIPNLGGIAKARLTRPIGKNEKKGTGRELFYNERKKEKPFISNSNYYFILIF